MSNLDNFVLKDDEINAVSGGLYGCVYNGREYSVGAVINLGGNMGQRCLWNAANASGYWSDPFPQKFNDSQKYL